DDCQRSIAIHGDALALAALNRLQVKVLDRAVLPSLVFRRLFQSRRAADVERTHRELRAGLADGLRSNDAHRLANFYRPSCCQVAAVALDAATATRFAGQHRTNADALHAGTLNL